MHAVQRECAKIFGERRLEPMVDLRKNPVSRSLQEV